MIAFWKILDVLGEYRDKFPLNSKLIFIEIHFKICIFTFTQVIIVFHKTSELYLSSAKSFYLSTSKTTSVSNEEHSMPLANAADYFDVLRRKMMTEIN